MMDHGAPNSAPRSVLLPWHIMVRIALLGLVVFGAARFLAPASGSPVAIGLIIGLMGSLLSPRNNYAWPLAIGALASAALLANPPFAILCLLALGLCAIAGFESVNSGGRAGVIALYGWIAVQSIPGLAPLSENLPVLVASLGATWVLARVLGVTGLAAQPPAPKAFGPKLTLFLIIGLGLTTAVEWQLEDPHAYWIALIFVMRAIAPPGQVRPAALRFTIGTIAGAVAAVLLQQLDLDLYPKLGISTALALTGLWALRHPVPFAPACFCCALLTLAAPGIEPAVFRAEVTVSVLLLTTALTLIISGVWALTEGRGSGQH